MTFSQKLDVLRFLENQRIIKELIPQHDGQGGSIWSWEILKPELLPTYDWLVENKTKNNGLIVL